MEAKGEPQLDEQRMQLIKEELLAAGGGNTLAKKLREYKLQQEQETNRQLQLQSDRDRATPAWQKEDDPPPDSPTADQLDRPRNLSMLWRPNNTNQMFRIESAYQHQKDEHECEETNLLRTIADKYYIVDGILFKIIISLFKYMDTVANKDSSLYDIVMIENSYHFSNTLQHHLGDLPAFQRYIWKARTQSAHRMDKYVEWLMVCTFRECINFFSDIKEMIQKRVVDPYEIQFTVSISELGCKLKDWLGKDTIVSGLQYIKDQLFLGLQEPKLIGKLWTMVLAKFMEKYASFAFYTALCFPDMLSSELEMLPRLSDDLEGASSSSISDDMESSMKDAVCKALPHMWSKKIMDHDSLLIGDFADLEDNDEHHRRRRRILDAFDIDEHEANILYGTYCMTLQAAVLITYHGLTVDHIKKEAQGNI